jgi:hypothetical protein
VSESTSKDGREPFVFAIANLVGVNVSEMDFAYLRDFRPADRQVFMELEVGRAFRRRNPRADSAMQSRFTIYHRRILRKLSGGDRERLV